MFAEALAFGPRTEDVAEDPTTKLLYRPFSMWTKLLQPQPLVRPLA